MFDACLVIFLIGNHFDEEERVGYVTFILFLLPCFGTGFVCVHLMSVPHSVMVWPVICDCRISWPSIALGF